MLSTDRLLWILQNTLFFIAVLVWANFLIPADAACTDVTCQWIYTYPDGQQVTASPSDDLEDSNPYGVAASVVIVAIASLWSLALGAIIFCLRRIAHFLRMGAP